MQITIVNDEHGDPEAHRAGCRHVGRNPHTQNHPGGLTFEAGSHEGVVGWFYDDQLAEAGEEAKDNLYWVPLAPCLRGLPTYESDTTPTDAAQEPQKEEGRMADTTYAPGTQVLARKYMVEKKASLADKTGVVEAVDGSVIKVNWGPDVGTLEMRASHIMLAKNGGSSAQASTPSVTESPGGSADRALDPEAPEITDADVTAMRSERQQTIGHLLDPADPAFGGAPDHSHGEQERAVSTIKSGSLDDLRAWHANGHNHLDPTTAPHPVSA